MAWVDICIGVFQSAIRDKISGLGGKKGAVKKALKAESKATGIPFNTLEKWYYGVESKNGRDRQTNETKSKSDIEPGAPCYIRKEVEALTGIPARRIQFYSDTAVKPSIEDAGIRGKRRKYSRQDILKLLVVAELHKYGIPLSKAKWILEEAEKDKVFEGTIGTMLRQRRYIYVYEDSVSFVKGGHVKINPKTGEYVVPAETRVPMRDFGSALIIDVSNLAARVPE